jgi:hypothetical protein
LGRNHGGTLAFFLQKSVGFPLENNLAFHGLAGAASCQSSCKRFFVVSPIKKFLKTAVPENSVKMRTPFKWLL